MSSFEAGERRWIDRLGNLRNTVRQEMIRLQLAEHIAPGLPVLDAEELAGRRDPYRILGSQLHVIARRI